VAHADLLLRTLWRIDDNTVHILSMNGESYRLTQSARRRKPAAMDVGDQSAVEAVDPDTGEITTR
jgi:hypothetical protein